LVRIGLRLLLLDRVLDSFEDALRQSELLYPDEVEINDTLRLVGLTQVQSHVLTKLYFAEYLHLLQDLPLEAVVLTSILLVNSLAHKSRELICHFKLQGSLSTLLQVEGEQDWTVIRPEDFFSRLVVLDKTGKDSIIFE